MVVLDIAIVNVALPSIQADLKFSEENLQWVISAYSLVFGVSSCSAAGWPTSSADAASSWQGLVVFSGRLAPLWPRVERHGAHHLRALQGLGAATITPSALSILTTTFHEGATATSRSAWGAVGGFGAAAGVLMGGI